MSRLNVAPHETRTVLRARLLFAFLARQTGFSDDDLELFFKALEDMFEHARLAARGQMAMRGLYVFEHDSALGKAHAHTLLGKPRIAGTRIGVEFLLDLLVSGWTEAQILDQYPHLKAEDLQAVFAADR